MAVIGIKIAHVKREHPTEDEVDVIARTSKHS
jgi:hypothetical protein